MKTFAIFFTLITLGMFVANCGAKAERSETKPTVAANTQTNTANADAPQTKLTPAIKRDNDVDADDKNIGQSNSNGKSDMDDVRSKSVNSNNNKIIRGKDRDDLNKKGDADDRGKRRDSDGDDDDS